MSGMRPPAGSDLALAMHLSIALQMYREQLERNGSSVPVGLRDLEAIASFRVRPGQGGSVFDRTCVCGDGAAVTPRLLTFAQVGSALSTSLSTVKRLAGSGALVTVRVNGAPRVRVADLDSYVAGLAGAVKEPAA